MVNGKWWIVLAFVLGVVLSGCSYNRQLKVVADITPDGEVTYHTEFVAEF
jgi:hypothetical protein